MYPMILDIKNLGTTREKIKKSLEEEEVERLTSCYAKIQKLDNRMLF